MAKIKNIKVKVSYTVWLEDVDVSDKVLESLMDLYILGNVKSDYRSTESLDDAYEWVSDNIVQADAIEIDTEVEELEI